MAFSRCMDPIYTDHSASQMTSRCADVPVPFQTLHSERIYTSHVVFLAHLQIPGSFVIA